MASGALLLIGPRIHAGETTIGNVGGAGQTTESHSRRVPQFENQDVKAWRTILFPNQPVPMHRHDHPFVIVALKGGTVRITQQSGASEQRVWETGKAYWMPASPPNTMHSDVNIGSEPIELMVVELEKEK